MSVIDGKPVIIGAGLTGLSISRVLAQVQIPHLLIGSAPNELPRLGESLNLEGTLGLLELFPEFSQYCFRKNVVAAYVGDFVFWCSFAVNKTRTSRLLFKALGYTAPSEFLQFDRLGFDAAVYAQTVTSQYCTAVDTKVSELEYNPKIDHISTIQLANGTTIHPSYVFDASNHGRLLGRAVKLDYNTFGPKQRVAYTHYHACDDAGRQTKQQPWELATSIVRLYRHIDSVDAVAWCIPLGTYVSIGISLADDETTLPDDALLQLSEQAFARRGLHYRERFSTPTTIMSLQHQYFLFERAYGANWLLAGPSYCQVWWMAGAGVGTAFAAAMIAPDVLRHPLKAGRMYQDYLQDLVNIHRTFDWFAYTDYRGITTTNIAKYSDRFIITNIRRLAKSTHLRKKLVHSVFGYLVATLFKHAPVIKNYCPARSITLAEQTEYIFGNSQ